MKDIKERVRDKNRRFEIRLPDFRKNWLRSAVLEAKEKPRWRNYMKKAVGSRWNTRKQDGTKRTAGWKGAASVAAYRGGKPVGKVKKLMRSDLAGGKEKPLQPRWTAKQEAVEHLDRQGAKKGRTGAGINQVET